MAPRVDEVATALVAGLAEGAVIALLAVAVVVTWGVHRRFDLSLGEVATAAALTLSLLTGAGAPWPLAAVGAVAVGVVLALAVERVVVRPALAGPAGAVPLVTAGAALLGVGVVEVGAGGGGVAIPPPPSPAGPPLGGPGTDLLTWAHLLALAVLVIGVGAVVVVLRRTSGGTVLRAVAADPGTARLVGMRPEPAARVAWGLAGALAGGAGVAVGGAVGALTPGIVTVELLVPAIAAAVVAGGTSMPVAVVAALLLGCLGQLAGIAAPDALPVPGVVLATAVLVLLAVAAPRRLGVPR